MRENPLFEGSVRDSNFRFNVRCVTFVLGLHVQIQSDFSVTAKNSKAKRVHASLS